MVEYSALGIISLVLGIIAIITIVFPSIFPMFIFGTLAVTFAVIAYLSQWTLTYRHLRRKYPGVYFRAHIKGTKLMLAGFILGVINLIISILTLLK